MGPFLSPWADLLRARLAGPVRAAIVTSGQDTGGAAGASSPDALWSAAQVWLDAFHAAHLAPGDRIVLAVDAGEPFIPALVAGLMQGLTLVIIRSPQEAPRDLLGWFDARMVVAAPSHAGVTCSAPSGCAAPSSAIAARSALNPPTPLARLIVRTSGTSGRGRWIALSDENLLSVLATHGVLAAVEETRALSVLPWHHSFGLVFDLLAALVGQQQLICAAGVARDPQQLLEVAHRHGITHLNAVPLTVERLLETAGGLTFLRGLSGGLIGGAAISGALARQLRGSRLAVGYGQTEAAPGICRGDPGMFSDCWIGSPVGCAVRIDDDGVLAFKGPNACVGEWTHAGFLPYEPGRWVRTGDLVRSEGDGFVYEGRLADGFKMSNGRFLSALRLETALLQALPSLSECMVGTVDGRHLEIALSTRTATSPDLEQVTAVLEPWGCLQFRLHMVANDAWQRSPKGDLIRRAAPWHGADRD